ncbi:zinc finger protein 474 [Caerostris extrusa]|uniref:Zinc finger protein 474 n=1 Tax=Caerostris extrusa TaxID=172846 RepID=A0AAV4TG87_CAEEX|nr:zinc finger protein 474 [Caerostris extrusa]
MLLSDSTRGAKMKHVEPEKPAQLRPLLREPTPVDPKLWQQDSTSEEEIDPPTTPKEDSAHEIRPATRTLLTPTPNIVHPVIPSTTRTIREQPKLRQKIYNSSRVHSPIDPRRSRAPSPCCLQSLLGSGKRNSGVGIRSRPTMEERVARLPIRVYKPTARIPPQQVTKKGSETSRTVSDKGGPLRKGAALQGAPFAVSRWMRRR